MLRNSNDKDISSVLDDFDGSSASPDVEYGFRRSRMAKTLSRHDSSSLYPAHKYVPVPPTTAL